MSHNVSPNHRPSLNAHASSSGSNHRMSLATRTPVGHEFKMLERLNRAEQRVKKLTKEKKLMNKKMDQYQAKQAHYDTKLVWQSIQNRKEQLKLQQANASKLAQIRKLRKAHDKLKEKIQELAERSSHHHHHHHDRPRDGESHSSSTISSTDEMDQSKKRKNQMDDEIREALSRVYALEAGIGAKLQEWEDEAKRNGKMNGENGDDHPDDDGEDGDETHRLLDLNRARLDGSFETINELIRETQRQKETILSLHKMNESLEGKEEMNLQVREQLKESRTKIKTMEIENMTNDLKISQLERTVNLLNDQIESKTIEIAQLKKAQADSIAKNNQSDSESHARKSLLGSGLSSIPSSYELDLHGADDDDEKVDSQDDFGHSEPSKIEQPKRPSLVNGYSATAGSSSSVDTNSSQIDQDSSLKMALEEINQLEKQLAHALNDSFEAKKQVQSKSSQIILNQSIISAKEDELASLRAIEIALRLQIKELRTENDSLSNQLSAIQSSLNRVERWVRAMKSTFKSSFSLCGCTCVSNRKLAELTFGDSSKLPTTNGKKDQKSLDDGEADNEGDNVPLLNKK